ELVKDLNEKAKRNPESIKNMKISWASLFKRGDPQISTTKTVTTIHGEEPSDETIKELMA
ncbi:Hypothetical protein FKW44_025309, partial [Caligus rogercresseyi]